jgi:hypothetical protein
MDNPQVTLNIDLTRAVRGLGAQQLLLQALVSAPATEIETDYIEWKSVVDLADKDWRAEAAKHILAFANRDPHQSRTALEGCAYLVFGAEPSRSVGTPVHDLADIDKWVRTYTGDDANSPNWRFDYVTVGTVIVGLFTIEPPRDGDPPYAFRKDYLPGGTKRETFLDGDVYVRKGGRSEKAKSADHLRLAARARAGSTRLEATVEARADDLALALDLSPEAVEAWQKEERTRLLDSQRAAPIGYVSMENRSREQFEAQVDKYVARTTAVVPGELKRRILGIPDVGIHVRLKNETPDNFRGVTLELTVTPPSSAYMYESDIGGDRFPSRPARWGESFATGFNASSLGLQGVGPIVRAAVSRIEDSGETVIEYAAVDLRPNSTRQLEELYVFVPPHLAGKTLEIPWRLTGADIRGDIHGEISVPVRPRVVSATDLVPFTISKPEGPSI